MNLYISPSILAVAILLTGCKSIPKVAPNLPTSEVPDGNVREFRMKVGRVGGVKFSDDEARAILAEASLILSRKDSSTDEPAQIRLVLEADKVDEVETKTFEINTPTDHNALAKLGYNVIVVRAINECGGYIPEAVGCAGKGSFMAVERYNSPLEAMIWAHEFGHNAGLSHRADNGRALLHPQLHLTHRDLNEDEKRAYENKSHRVGTGDGGVHAAVIDDGHGTSLKKDHGPPPRNVQAYLERVYIEGIPYEHVAGFKAKDVPALRTALASSSSRQQSAAIVALAAIADWDSLGAVLDFVENNKAPLSNSRVTRTAVMALGYVIQTASKRPDFASVRTKALDALKARLKPNPNLFGGGGVADELASSAIAGLALSGDTDAYEILNSELAPGLDIFGAGGAANSKLNHALNELKEVQDKGIQQYTER